MEGFDGQLPKLDMYNMLRMAARLTTSIKVVPRAAHSQPLWAVLPAVERLQVSLWVGCTVLRPQWLFTSQYMRGLTLYIIHRVRRIPGYSVLLYNTIIIEYIIIIITNVLIEYIIIIINVLILHVILLGPGREYDMV